jgi:hypothetical protein
MTVQDATQGMFFNAPSQATLHPFLAYINIDGKIVPHSMCVFSDCLNHDAISVNAFLKPVLMYVKSISPAVDTIKYFTDGAAGQYKNCKNFANLLHHEEDFNIKYAEWNFFATSHGKGPCDGIGGTIKRLAFRHSLQGGDIQTPFALFQWCTQHIANMKMFYVSSEDVRENQTRLNPRLSEAKTLPGTQSFHRFVPSSTSKYHMNATDISENENFKTFQILPIPETYSNVDFNSVSTGNHVACFYSEDGKWYLAKVIDRNNEQQECLMQFYQPSGEDATLRGFKSSTNAKDQAWVPCADFLKIINSLEKTSRSGRTYKLSTIEHNQVSQLFINKLQDH